MERRNFVKYLGIVGITVPFVPVVLADKKNYVLVSPGVKITEHDVFVSTSFEAQVQAFAFEPVDEITLLHMDQIAIHQIAGRLKLDPSKMFCIRPPINGLNSIYHKNVIVGAYKLDGNELNITIYPLITPEYINVNFTVTPEGANFDGVDYSIKISATGETPN